MISSMTSSGSDVIESLDALDDPTRAEDFFLFSKPFEPYANECQ
jgi:hypothetical protein